MSVTQAAPHSVAMRIIPVTQVEAKAFIAKHHRHNIPSIGSVFQVGIRNGNNELIGVAMVGIPKARMLMDGRTLEVTRVCVLDNNRNANSMLYGVCARVARSLGWGRLITYTLVSESGSSLRGAGWTLDSSVAGGNPEGWLRNHGKGTTDLFGNQRLPPAGPKNRWIKEL